MCFSPTLTIFLHYLLSEGQGEKHFAVLLLSDLCYFCILKTVPIADLIVNMRHKLCFFFFNVLQQQTL